MAYVGGGYTKSGIHNILEPATFGIPVVIGPNYKKFKEAQDLIALKACEVTSNQEEVSRILNQLKTKRVLRITKGESALDYIENSLGASDKITAYIEKLVAVK